jgi:hypothetical protein
MKFSRTIVHRLAAAAVVVGALGGLAATATPAQAHDRDHGRHGWHERERDWRWHQPNYYYVAPPRYAYVAPPPLVYVPQPAPVYAPPPSISLVFPLNFH